VRGVLHTRPRRHRSPSTPSMNAQRGGPILPSPYPHVSATTAVTP
jgi:hypothetical protein